MKVESKYKSVSAREAEAGEYGEKRYWDYLEQQAHELHSYYTKRGDHAEAAKMLTRSLSEALSGNEGN